jgi:DNA-directed RNA polymerase subunit RPC12/RpoP
MCIPDPVELMKSNIDRMSNLVDNDGNYPCPSCGKKFDIETGFACSAAPDADVVCPDCAVEMFPEWFKKL